MGIMPHLRSSNRLSCYLTPIFSGKARRIFEEVSRLPRSQQQHILAVVETFVEKKAVAQ